MPNGWCSPSWTASRSKLVLAASESPDCNDCTIRAPPDPPPAVAYQYVAPATANEAGTSTSRCLKNDLPTRTTSTTLRTAESEGPRLPTCTSTMAQTPADGSAHHVCFQLV